MEINTLIKPKKSIIIALGFSMFILVSNCTHHKQIQKSHMNAAQCSNCFEIDGFLIHNTSKSVYSNDGKTKEKVLEEATQIIFHWEVFDISAEEESFLLSQTKKTGFKKLPIREMKLPAIPTKFLESTDNGYYIHFMPQGNPFGKNRFLIINLKKKYLIWYLFG